MVFIRVVPAHLHLVCCVFCALVVLFTCLPSPQTKKKEKEKDTNQTHSIASLERVDYVCVLLTVVQDPRVELTLATTLPSWLKLKDPLLSS